MSGYRGAALNGALFAAGCLFAAFSSNWLAALFALGAAITSASLYDSMLREEQLLRMLGLREEA